MIRPPGIVDPPLPRFGPSPLARRSYNTPLLLGVALLFAAGVKLFGPAWARTIFTEGSLSRPSDGWALAIAFAASILLHELGHLVAAMALGFDVLALNLGPVRYSRSDGKWSFEVRRDRWMTASVVAVPPLRQRGDEDRWRRDMLLVIAAGPLATFLAIVVPAYLLTVAGPYASGRTTVAFLAELNAILFVLGLIPNGQEAAVRNDASLLSALLTNGREGREILLYQMLVQLILQGFRPCFYPERLIREMAASRTRADFAAVFAETVSQWAWDRGDVVTAEAWIERAVEAAGHCDERILSRALSQCACFSLIVFGDRQRARSLLGVARREMLSPVWLKHRTAAVAALAENKMTQAEKELRRAQAAFQKQVPYFEFERKLLQSLVSLTRAT